MDRDPELEAIRARLRAEIADGASAAPQPPAADAKPIEADDESLQRLVREHNTLVVDVWAPWCGPCRIIGPTVDELARELAGSVTFAKVNADHNPGTMQAFGIQGIPTLLIFKNGRLADRVVGVLPKQALKAQILRAGTRGQSQPGPRR